MVDIGQRKTLPPKGPRSQVRKGKRTYSSLEYASDMFDAQCYDSAWDAVSRDRPKFNQMAKATKAQVCAGSKIANSDNSKGPGQVLKVGYWENLIRSV